jgi:hypothetical protein
MTESTSILVGASPWPLVDKIRDLKRTLNVLCEIGALFDPRHKAEFLEKFGMFPTPSEKQVA